MRLPIPTPESLGSVPSHPQQRLAPRAQEVSNQSANVVCSLPHNENEGSLWSAADKVQEEKKGANLGENETDFFGGD